MPVWCPDCHGMLVDGTEQCPRCGAHIGGPESKEVFTGSDVAWFSAYTIAIILIPIIAGVGIALLCLFIFFIRN